MERLPASIASRSLRLRTGLPRTQRPLSSPRALTTSSPALAACNPKRAPSRSVTHFRSQWHFNNTISTSRRSYASDAPSELRKTPLYDLHVEHGGKMVPFAGFSMPVQYSDQGIGESHRFTREKASLFDVGHMVQHRLSGPGAASLLERLTPAGITDLATHTSTLSCLLHPLTGGIVDDVVIARLGPEAFYLVTNAACREKDTAYLTEHISEWNAGTQAGGHSSHMSTSSATSSTSVEWEILDGWGLVALQGPTSAEILGSLLPVSERDLSGMTFGQSRFMQLTINGKSDPGFLVLVSRAGYTGEDGFEISIKPEYTETVTRALLSAGSYPTNIRFAGLGARDSLRLEAGMCLYGHDLNDDTTPVEAALGWIVAKNRRHLPTQTPGSDSGVPPSLGTFHGAETIIPQFEKGGINKRRVGLVVEPGLPAREGATLVSPDNPEEVLGYVTSGCPSPSLDNKNIAMGYVTQKGMWKAGTKLKVKVRGGKLRDAEVVKMPFLKSNLYRGTGTAPA